MILATNLLRLRSRVGEMRDGAAMFQIMVRVCDGLGWD
jgi:hypothetical protein